MSFLAKMFTSSRGLNFTPPTTHTAAETAGDWDLVSAEEAAGFYPDRLTLFLGPHLETRHHMLLIDIPKTSALLTYVGSLEPTHRYMHLTALDIPMLTSYLELQTLSADALASTASWLDVIKLAITAEVLEDAVVETKAIEALHRKQHSLSPGPSLNHHECAFARMYQLATGAGDTLMQTLNAIVNSAGAGRPRVSKRRPWSGDAKYGKSVLRGQGLGGVKMEGDCGKEHPRRQPMIPPSVDALKGGSVGNFVWLKKRASNASSICSTLDVPTHSVAVIVSHLPKTCVSATPRSSKTTTPNSSNAAALALNLFHAPISSCLPAPRPSSTNRETTYQPYPRLEACAQFSTRIWTSASASAP
ncbi:hypothetical protein BDW02DRAFT_643672 [Decorospora gaudefroyi]|uniref:Uncharacterized protein n=1 Tax=Decorospora gaudefroyi TaxID=184978 RepID=A0A6A5KTM7_9PLEO|nr:hypothetical protein BDW02DRAFT_643672 [Decorospora gaudefroyi]